MRDPRNSWPDAQLLKQIEEARRFHRDLSGLGGTLAETAAAITQRTFADLVSPAETAAAFWKEREHLLRDVLGSISERMTGLTALHHGMFEALLGPQNISAQLGKSLAVVTNLERQLMEQHRIMSSIHNSILPSRVFLDNFSRIADIIDTYADQSVAWVAGVGLRAIVKYEDYTSHTLMSLENAHDQVGEIRNGLRICAATDNIQSYLNITDQLCELSIRKHPHEAGPLRYGFLRPNFYSALDEDTSERKDLSFEDQQPASVVICRLAMEVIGLSADHDGGASKPLFNRSPEAPVIAANFVQLVVTDRVTSDRWSLLAYKYFVQSREKEMKHLLGEEGSRVIDDIIILRKQASYDFHVDPSADRRRSFLRRLKNLYVRRCGEPGPSSRQAWMQIQESLLSDLRHLLTELRSNRK